MARQNRSEVVDATQNVLIRSLLGAVLALPYATRVRLMGRLATTVIAPAAGWRRRIRENLAHACPDLSASEVERLVRAVPDNVGRTLIEIYSGGEFKRHVAGTPLEGPGVETLHTARAEGRPVALVTAHMGNFDALRAILFSEGYEVAGLYREMNNPRFNDHYVKALSEIGTPLFPTKREGVAQFVRHLARGGIIGILTDVYNRKGAETTFFGKSAPTSTAACHWAVKHGAVVIPCYGLRQPDGLSFRLVMEDPVPHGDPVEMTQEINDRLEAVVRENMDQWFWIHRRWKPERKRKRR
ncbi:KDO2-lipid IV(A) lauroyltransferase [Palleronia marisminoris]|uniref:Lipid A biosynthesis lauroyl acyltransferase n=1 Tax=Palleronia marisminoris TaxID=315423 RepID=A0A1Y5RDG4_9RHOB|nr:lysophospholipid acyltransferase family protein [Palleronia marisminoris]SFG14088.1 KDO2-lipid IV(A) lauroyltransferase [Palleronia marisminoris]SLN14881.1 Lipid A biosynthesis lauroyl acyltransferase [Palleronia marisminoris]